VTALLDDPLDAAALLRAGALVAFATETVYGLGADARNPSAVAAIFEAKGRPHFNPLICHFPNAESAWAEVRPDDRAVALAAAFWPGPLTLVLPRRADCRIDLLAGAGLDTLAVRVPDHAGALALLRAAATPIAAPSANPSGRISPTRADHVIAGLGGRIAAVLDGGACPVGVESTIVGFDPAPCLLRPGGLVAERIAQFLGAALLPPPDMLVTPNAPGQLASHYAPAARLRLGITDPSPDEVHIAFGAAPGALNLSAAGDLTEAAAALFHLLRRADALAGAQGRISVAPIPAHGLGHAINDRLTRAAAPRPKT